MKYGIVCCDVWDHTEFKSMSAKGMLSLIFLWTHQNRNSCGIYRSSVVGIGDLFPNPIEEFLEGISEAERAGFIFLDHANKVILLHSYAKYCHPGNVNIVKSWVPVLKTIPKESPLKKQWYDETLKALRDGFREPFQELFADCSGINTEPQTTAQTDEPTDTNDEVPAAEVDLGASKSQPKRKTVTKMSDEEFIAALKANTAYRGVDIDHELNLMDSWLLANPGRKKTPKFIVNWLNRNLQKGREIAPPANGGHASTFGNNLTTQGRKNSALVQGMIQKRREGATGE